LLNYAGEVIGINCVSEDITDRKRVEEQAKLDKGRLSLALEAGNLGFWDWNVASGHVQFGGCWASMLGYDNSEIAPHISSWEAMIHPEDKAAVERALNKHLSGETPIYECEHRLKRKDGLWSWTMDRGRVIERNPNGSPIRALGIQSDITEQHEIREALKIQAKRKDEFLATLAHELRNPLAPIRTGLSIIKRDPGAPAAGLAREMMERQLSHMVRLIDDLLDVSRVTRGALELRTEETDIQSTLLAAIEASKPAIDAAKHTLVTNLPSEPIRAQIDSARISQVVSNLLINAAKYTPDGGKITLNLSALDSQAKITVQDTGIGIPTNMLGAIFEMFGQVNTAINRSHGGLGIGLALAQRIVEMHRGAIKARSAGEGMGSVFTVTLPALPPVIRQVSRELPMESESKLDQTKPHRAKVLVVDDNVDGASSLKMYLEMLGHDVSVAYDGEAALAAARSSMPDLVFLDIGLPGINGYEVAKRLREIPCQSPPLIAAVTGWGSEGDKRSSAEAGCDAHLTKPIDLSDAESLINRQLDNLHKAAAPQEP
jgi:PAS domain S-box-containing protein